MTDHQPEPTRRDPYILDRPTGRRLRARDALICVFVAVTLLLIVEGPSIRKTGEKMDAGWQRTLVLAVGEPAAAVADLLPLASAVDEATASLSPDEDLSGPGGFASPPPATGTGAGSGPPLVTAESFDPAALGAPAAKLPALRTLLVTGDSLAQPLDAELARRLSPDGVRTLRDAHLGTGISKTDLVDWGLLSQRQVRDDEPDATVMFMGANEGFAIPGAGGAEAECCGPEWAAAYANRARRMMDTFRRSGDARLYWLTLPMPRDPRRQRIARTVNEAIEVAAQPYRAHVRVLDMAAIFTPGGTYRSAMDVGGSETIVRDPDGIHLNDAGARIAADVVEKQIAADFAALG